MTDLVSIIMPSWNTAQFISEAIESVIHQTYTNWELIIVDDCSTDDTISIVNRYKDIRIRLFINSKNSGAAFSRNFALQKAKGRWVAFLDSDDLWLPEKLERQISFMNDNNYYFSCASCEDIDTNSNRMGKIHKSIKHISKKRMFQYCWPSCLTVMYDNSVVGLIQINNNLKKNNDYAMWLNVVQRVDCHYLDQVLALYRVRKNSISHDSLKKLIKAHYTLFRIELHKNRFVSFFLTLQNLFFGVFKKIVFEKHVHKE